MRTAPDDKIAAFRSLDDHLELVTNQVRNGSRCAFTTAGRTHFNPKWARFKSQACGLFDKIRRNAEPDLMTQLPYFQRERDDGLDVSPRSDSRHHYPHRLSIVI